MKKGGASSTALDNPAISALNYASSLAISSSLISKFE